MKLLRKIKVSPVGTFKVGEIKVFYRELIEAFGDPVYFEEGSKIDAEWVFETPEGIATIYNYKNGKNYLGAEGKDLEDIIDWHIGGEAEKVVKYITQALGL